MELWIISNLSKLAASFFCQVSLSSERNEILPSVFRELPDFERVPRNNALHFHPNSSSIAFLLSSFVVVIDGVHHLKTEQISAGRLRKLESKRCFLVQTNMTVE